MKLKSKCKKHNCIVIHRRLARNLWRRTYWCICIYCDEFVSGPHDDGKKAWKEADSITLGNNDY